MRKTLSFSFVIMFVLVVSLACQISSATDPGLESTQIALAIQQTSMVLQQNEDLQAESLQDDVVPDEMPTYTPYPTFTSQPVTEAPEETTPTDDLQPTDAPPPTATEDKLFQKVTTDRTVFYCVPSSGPTTLTITVEMSDVARGAALFWRLQGKTSGTKLDWEMVDMKYNSGIMRTITFDANTSAGTNNFYYPPMMGESWFQFQIVSNDGLERTEVFSNVTFFPCNQ